MSDPIKPFDPAEFLETEEDIREFWKKPPKAHREM